MNLIISAKLQISSFILSVSSQYVSFWRHKGRSWFLWWKVWIFYCWIFISYMPFSQNRISHVSSCFLCWATECDRLTTQQTNHPTNHCNVEIRLLRLCWAGASLGLGYSIVDICLIIFNFLEYNKHIKCCLSHYHF